jgi:hypothetical protein
MDEKEREADTAIVGLQNELNNLLLGAGVPPENNADTIKMIETFVGFMAMLLVASKDTAPNYLTFSLRTAENNYELTVRRADGLTPSEKIAELEDSLREARSHTLMEVLAIVDAYVEQVDILESYDTFMRAERFRDRIRALLDGGG